MSIGSGSTSSSIRKRFLAGPWLSIVVPVIAFIPALRGKLALSWWDGYGQYIPWFTLAAESWRSFRLPSWNPYPFAGAPLLAGGQAAVFYPPTMLFGFLPPVAANAISVVVTFIVAGTGAYFLARRLTGDTVAATVGGLGFGLCGFFFAHVTHQSLNASAAWLPWALLGYERFRAASTPWRLLTGGAAVAAGVFAGHLQIATFIFAVIALHAALSTLLSWRTERWRPAIAGAAILSVGLLLAAVQLVPTAAYVGLTQRTHVSFDVAVTYALPPSHAVLGVFPFLFGGAHDGPQYAGAWNLLEVTWYPGVAVLVLATIGLFGLRKQRSLFSITLVAGIAFTVALGSATPVARLVHLLPVYGQYRSWARYLLVVSLAVSMLAGRGVMVILGATKETHRVVVVRLLACCTVILGICAASLLAPGARRAIPAGVPLRDVLVPIGALAAATVLGILALRWRVAVVGFLGVVALEPLVVFGLRPSWLHDGATRAQIESARASGVATWGRVTDAPGGLDRFVYLGHDILPVIEAIPGVTDWQGLRSANGNDPLTPRDYAQAAGHVAAYGGVLEPERLWRTSSWILDLLRVSTVIVDPASARGGPPVESLLPAGQQLDGRLVRHEYRPRLPDAFLVGSVRQVTRSEATAALDGRAPFEPTVEAVIEQSCPACPRGAGGNAGRADVIEWGQNSVVVRIDATRPALLVVSQAHLPGWRASVDGRTVEVVRANGIVQGVPVPSGQHEVILRYVPPGLPAGAAISGLSLVGLGAAALVSRRGSKEPAG